MALIAFHFCCAQASALQVSPQEKPSIDTNEDRPEYEDAWLA